jgi:hypothetical protein
MKKLGYILMFGVAAVMLAIAAYDPYRLVGYPPIVLYRFSDDRPIETFKTIDECLERQKRTQNSYCPGYKFPVHYGGVVLRLEENDRALETFETMSECEEREKHTQDAYCTTWRGKVD